MSKNKVLSVLLCGASLVLLAACNDSKADVAQSTASVSAKKTPHEVCTDEVVTTQKPVKDKDGVQVVSPEFTVDVPAATKGK